MLLRISPQNIQDADIDRVIRVLKNDGVIIYPTDSVYALGCYLHSQKAISKICDFKKIRPEKANLTFICSGLRQISEFTKPISSPIFKLLKKSLPGPYTFILPAAGNVPKLFLKKTKNTIGVRIPDHPVCAAIVERLGSPLLTTSLHNPEDELLDYYTDAENIYQHYGEKVELVVDGGYGSIFPTTIIDCTAENPVLIREGIGTTDHLF